MVCSVRLKDIKIVDDIKVVYLKDVQGGLIAVTARMKDSFKTGIAFGLTSGAITTLGLMVGLHAGTHSRLAVIGGILTIAIADAFSDALGIHVSKESENAYTKRQVWAATIGTFLSKFFFALTFLIPLLFFEMPTSILISLAWGIAVLAGLSYIIAKAQQEPPWKVILEHLAIAVVVVIITHTAGMWISRMCPS